MSNESNQNKCPLHVDVKEGIVFLLRTFNSSSDDGSVLLTTQEKYVQIAQLSSWNKGGEHILLKVTNHLWIIAITLEDLESTNYSLKYHND